MANSVPADRIFGEREPIEIVRDRLQHRGIDPSALRAGFKQCATRFGGPYLVRCWILVDETGTPMGHLRFNRAGSMTLSEARWDNLSVEK